MGGFRSEFPRGLRGRNRRLFSVYPSRIGRLKRRDRISLGATYCIREGADERFRENAYGEELVLPVNGNVRKLVLPVCPNVHIFSVLLFIGAESGEEKRGKAEKRKNG